MSSILSEACIATPGWFWSSFTLNIFFHPFTCSLVVHLKLKWVSHSWYIVEFHLFIHFVLLCISPGEFNSPTCKVMVDKSEPTGATFLFAGGSVVPFFLSCRCPLWFDDTPYSYALIPFSFSFVSVPQVLSCDYYEAFIKHLIVITVYVMLITTQFWLHTKTLLF